MPRNVEIKAKIKDFSRTLGIVQSICPTGGQILKQKDIFFNAFEGRLKIRQLQDNSISQLISYKRPDIESPKLSDYSICPIENYEALLAVLSSALGVIGTIKKTRHLFHYNQTRIHVDRVEGLGDFLELEVVLSASQDPEEGTEIAKTLMQKLEITEEDLIKTAYVDLLLENKKN